VLFRSRSPSADRCTVQRHVKETVLGPRRRGELRRLGQELVPEALRSLWAEGHRQLRRMPPPVVRRDDGGDEDTRSIMRARRHSGGDTEDASAFSDEDKKAHSILAGVMEEGRVLVSLIQLCALALGKDLHLLVEATALVDKYDFPGDEGLSCQGGTDERSQANLAKALVCPLRFGAQGLAALRAAADLGPHTYWGAAC